MARQIIAVGSTRGPKLDAVRDALKEFASLLAPDGQFEVMGFDVDSGVRHTPLSSADSMRGAQQRAHALVSMPAIPHGKYSYFVGLEGGLEVLTSPAPQSDLQGPARRVLLESWAYVTDGARGHFGRSGGIELPEALAQEVLDGGVELAAAIDKFSGRAGVRDGHGAWGVLSGSLITRREAFRVALVAAFAPFYNAALFHRARAAG
jgi:non-canonical (house-cleaning) NTP pyrophosphatase